MNYKITVISATLLNIYVHYNACHKLTKTYFIT